MGLTDLVHVYCLLLYRLKSCEEGMASPWARLNKVTLMCKTIGDRTRLMPDIGSWKGESCLHFKPSRTLQGRGGKLRSRCP